MILEFAVILAGVLTGTLAGILPGIGITVSLILLWPFLVSFGVTELILFYIALASTVQYTGTIPSVFFGVPGESNSLPASIEGPKFARKNQAMLAIGGAQVSSIIGATVGCLITLFLLYLLVPYLQYFFNGTFKLFLYSTVLVMFLFLYNKGNIFVNGLLILAGFILSLPGEDPVDVRLRYTFGIQALDAGIPLFPILVGFLVVPSITQKSMNPTAINIDKSKVKASKIFTWVFRNIRSVFRGSVVGYFCGFIPGAGTTVGTNASYSLEKKLNPNSPGKQLLSAESANNSGSLATLLPLLLLGIPITGSEVIVYSLLVDAGWNPLRVNSVQEAFDLIFKDLSIWYVLINLLGIIVAWPFAKKVAYLITKQYNTLLIVLFVILYLVNAYLGTLDYRIWFVQACFCIFCLLGYLGKKYNFLPLIFMFIISSDFEAVAYRFWVINF